mmetsp:Transcript_39286/g.84111  ORF Transcript_39286/g.84111 Transcript_39286/m.84111 type:complete len:239 (+) Transcript_39286:521-1237(+)
MRRRRRRKRARRPWRKRRRRRRRRAASPTGRPSRCSLPATTWRRSTGNLRTRPATAPSACASTRRCGRTRGTSRSATTATATSATPSTPTRAASTTFRRGTNISASIAALTRRRKASGTESGPRMPRRSRWWATSTTGSPSRSTGPSRTSSACGSSSFLTSRASLPSPTARASSAGSRPNRESGWSAFPRGSSGRRRRGTRFSSTDATGSPRARVSRASLSRTRSTSSSTTDPRGPPT